jgi:hypothetical protein
LIELDNYDDKYQVFFVNLAEKIEKVSAIPIGIQYLSQYSLVESMETACMSCPVSWKQSRRSKYGLSFLYSTLMSSGIFTKKHFGEGYLSFPSSASK